jgi:PST family polysaccharide transporter
MINRDPWYLKYLPIEVRRRMEGRQNFFAVAHNVWWLVTDKFVKAVAALFVGAWVARYLGPTQYGQLAYVFAIVSFFQVVSILGLDGIVVRDIARRRHEAAAILGTTFLLRFLVGLSCWLGLVLFMLTKYGWSDVNVVLSILIGGGLIFQAADTIDLWFQSQTQSRRTVFAKFVAVLVSALLRVLFIHFKAPLVYFAFAFFVEFGICALALVLSYQRFQVGEKWTFQFKERGRTLLSESWPFLISSVSVMIYFRIDQIMIRNMLGEQELGIYSAVILFSTGWYFISATVNSSLLPMMVRYKETDEKLFLKRLASIFRLLLILGLLISMMTIWQADNLIQVFYGAKYSSGVSVLSIHIFTIIPIFMSAGQNLWIYIEGKSALFLKQNLIGGAVSLLLNPYLIKEFGIVGAALGAVVAQTCAMMFANFFLDRKLFSLQFGFNPNRN